MPKVGSWYSKFCFEKKKKKQNKKKNKLHLILKKNPAELGFLGSISQTRRQCIYERWTTEAGWGEALRLFYGEHVLAILEPVRLDWNWGIIHECSRTYRNNAILSFDFIICQSEQFTVAIRLIFTHLIQMITDIHI